MQLLIVKLLILFLKRINYILDGLNNGRDSVQATVMVLSGDKVGIGTTAPADDLHVYGAGNVALLESSSENVWLQMKGSTTYSWQIGVNR